MKLGAGGSLTNGAAADKTAQIVGGRNGVYVGGGKATVTNFGTIFGMVGIAAGTGMTSATVVNSGAIIGFGGTAVSFASGLDRVVVDPGATFFGNVVASSGAGNVLELASAASAGTIAGIGTSFVNFSTVESDAKARWSVAGSTTLAAGTTMTVGAAGSLTLTGDIGGPGTIAISAKAMLLADGTVASAMKFLAGGSATVSLAEPIAATGTIGGFIKTDTIDLLGTVATGISFSTTTDVLTVTGAGGTIAALHFSGSYTASFVKGSDGHGGTRITLG